jgi:hypothetical protein
MIEQINTVASKLSNIKNIPKDANLQLGYFYKLIENQEDLI